jgi:ABC-2 type transport system permease protein
MNRIFDIMLKDLRELLRNRMTFLFFLLMPILFTFLFGAAFGGFSKPAGDARLPVGFLDRDNSVLSGKLEELLSVSTVFRLVEEQAWNEANLQDQVASEDLAAAIVIPAGYGQTAADGTPPKLVLIADTTTVAGQTIQNDLLAAAGRLMDAIRTARIVAAVSGDPASFDSALANSLAAWQNPPVRVAVTTGAAAETGQGSGSATFARTSPGMMLQFAIAGLLTCAQVVVSERKSRCLQRLLTTTASHAQILLGHYLAIVSLLLVQFLILIVFGQVVLKLNYLREPLATLLVALAAALCIGGLGLLIGALARSEEQAIMFSLLMMFVLSALGGAWVPLEVAGPTFRIIGHLSPVAWALDGFQNILSRGQGLGAVIVPILALIGYGLVFFLLAAWRLKSMEER